MLCVTVRASHRSIIAVFLAGLPPTVTSGGEVVVEPGEGTISAVLANAHAGDVIRLKAGEYRDAIKLPGNCTLVGEGPDKTILIASEYAAITIAEPNVRIRRLEIQKAGDKMTRGVSSDVPVHIEQCRFRGVPEAVALRGAPLCDVVHCEFIECGIGVRAIGGSSPTVWGCLFTGGRTDGGPNIRNNLFHQVEEGIRLISKEPHVMVIRNNVFLNVGKTGLLILPGKLRIPIAAVRNNVFDGPAPAITGPSGMLAMVSHNAVHGSDGPPFRNPEGQSVLDVEQSSTVELETGASLDESGDVVVKVGEGVLNVGARECHQAEGANAMIGLIKGHQRPGCRPHESATAPGPRWAGPRFVANSVGEEYLCLRVWNAQSTGQGLLTKDGRSIDEVSISRDGKNETVEFDVTGFICEMGFKP